jgi:hypothetical protein
MLNRILTAVDTSLAALAILALPLMPAHADGTRSTSCVGSYGAFSCVTKWHRDRKDANVVIAKPDPLEQAESKAKDVKDVIGKPDPQEQAESKARERRWLARCRPVEHQDEYGVMRYVYAAPGCEFGRYQ